MSKDVVPIRSLPAELDAEQLRCVAWRFDLPDADAASTGLELKRTLFLARLAGLGGVAITGYAGERETVPAVSSTVAGGAATAGAARHKAKWGQTMLQPNGMDKSRYGEYQRPNATVKLNATVLGQRVIERMRHGAARQVAWAAELDSAIRQGLRNAALVKLMQDIRQSSVVELSVTGAYASNTIKAITSQDPEILVTSGILYAAGVAIPSFLN
jgi:hypothetical protein